jgi:hypothetical protein
LTGGKGVSGGKGGERGEKVSGRRKGVRNRFLAINHENNGS